ncbi:hypothetical protein GCM10027569_05360 [Flindersiella endophytica]
MGKDLLAEFRRPPLDLEKALIYCDMTASPTGKPVPVEERIADIYARYDEEDPVTRATRRSEPSLLAATRCITQRLSP